MESQSEPFNASGDEPGPSPSHGKNSSYLFHKNSFLSRRLEANATEHTIQENFHLNADIEPRTMCRTLSREMAPVSQTEAHGRVFDHEEGEGPHNIIYAPAERPKRDQPSRTCEVRPIIAATIVKLVEKLTHQYGMGRYRTASIGVQVPDPRILTMTDPSPPSLA